MTPPPPPLPSPRIITSLPSPPSLPPSRNFLLPDLNLPAEELSDSDDVNARNPSVSTSETKNDPTTSHCVTRIVLKLRKEDSNGQEVKEGIESLEKDVTALDDGSSKTVTTTTEIRKKRSFGTFSVSLAKEKIEADLLAMCRGGGGSKRKKTSRSKKRTKSVQNKLDDLYPGLRLRFITPDHYKVLEY